MICITIYTEEFWVFLIFVDLCISCFEEILMRDFIFFEIFISWVHDRFMWMVHDILNYMSDRKETTFCWGIHVSTETHGKILKNTASLNIDVHEATNPVIEVSSVIFLNLFQIFSNKRFSHEECLLKWFIHWQRWLLKLYFIFCICY